MLLWGLGATDASEYDHFRAPARFDKDRSASRPWSAKISRPPSRHNRRDGNFTPAIPTSPVASGCSPCRRVCSLSLFLARRHSALNAASCRGSKLWRAALHPSSRRSRGVLGSRWSASARRSPVTSARLPSCPHRWPTCSRSAAGSPCGAAPMPCHHAGKIADFRLRPDKIATAHLGAAAHQ